MRFLLLISLCISSPVFAKWICLLTFKELSGEYIFSPKVGDPVNSAVEGQSLYKLGEGNTGEIYRLETSAGVSTVKVFKDLKRFYDRDLGNFQLVIAGGDQRAKAEILYSGYSDLCANGIYLGFKIPKTRAIEWSPNPLLPKQPALEYETVEGRDLLSLLGDPRTSIELKKKLLTKYEAAVAVYCKHFGIHPTLPIRPPDWSKRLSNLDFIHIDTSIFVKTGDRSYYGPVHVVPDGIIVDARNLDLYLMDTN